MGKKRHKKRKNTYILTSETSKNTKWETITYMQNKSVKKQKNFKNGVEV